MSGQLLGGQAAVGRRPDLPALVEELQEAGLLDYAASIDASVIQNVPKELLQGTLLQAQGAAAGGSRAHHAGGGQPASAAGPAHSAIEAQHYTTLNNLADLASVKAMQLLQVTRLRVAQVTQNYNPRSTPSNEGGGKRRKTSRNADGSGGRAGGKGLRHFSMKVCEKVESKGRTTYNEVADELVLEMSSLEKGGQFDEKNIRRRVYDAINVLMAMEIIQKEKKDILWKGFPKTAGNAVDRLKSERANKLKEVEAKQAYLQDMMEQQKALKKLLERSGVRASGPHTGTQLHLPFILVQAKPDATVEVKISEDMSDVQFDFYHSPFQIHDDSYVLKNMAAQHALAHQPQQDQRQAAATAGAAPAQATGTAPAPAVPGAGPSGHPGPSPAPHLLGREVALPPQPAALVQPGSATAGAAASGAQHQVLAGGMTPQQLQAAALTAQHAHALQMAGMSGAGSAASAAAVAVAAAAAAAAASVAGVASAAASPLFPWPNGVSPTMAGGQLPPFHVAMPPLDPGLAAHLAGLTAKANPQAFVGSLSPHFAFAPPVFGHGHQQQPLGHHPQQQLQHPPAAHGQAPMQHPVPPMPGTAAHALHMQQQPGHPQLARPPAQPVQQQLPRGMPQSALPGMQQQLPPPAAQQQAAMPGQQQQQAQHQMAAQPGAHGGPPPGHLHPGAALPHAQPGPGQPAPPNGLALPAPLPPSALPGGVAPMQAPPFPLAV